MVWHKIHNWFLPHRDTHKKAHLISWEALLAYILVFILLQTSFSIIGYANPGVLGISSNIDQRRLIDLTNAERAKQGLSPVSENEALNKAAYLKAQNMFEENYWSHFSPSGKSPWDFILGSGYKFTYAGENLAKNFKVSDDVVSAWMASQTHRDNLLNPNYQDIGIAVVEGVLDGQQTTLVVQEFGTTTQVIAKKPNTSTQLAKNPTVTVEGKQIEVPKQEYENARLLVASITENKNLPKPLIDPHQLLKTFGLAIISLLTVLLALDLIILRKRGVFRLSSHHIAHMTILGITGVTLLSTSAGSIL